MKIALPSTAKNWLENPRLLTLGAARLGLLAVLLVAALFRFTGLKWDSGRNLHPDERFLAGVTNNLTWPESFANYFDPQTSTLSPYLRSEVGLFVYGTLPVYLVKWTAIRLGQDTYDQIYQVGRLLSGLFDLGAIFLLFLIGRRLYGELAGLLAAGLLALSVLNIQVSHFYTVDTFSNFFIMATFFFLLKVASRGRWIDFALTGLVFGMGLASKISIFPLLVPILLAAGMDLSRRLRAHPDKPAAMEQSIVRLVILAALAALTFRVLQPVAFAGPGFFNWSLNPRWLRDISEQARFITGAVDVPWLQQWVDRPVSFALYNLVVWGLGIPLGLAGFAGLALACFELITRRMTVHLLPAAYLLVTFAYHGAQFVKFMRYFLPIYPFLALFAAYLLVWAWRKVDSGEPVKLPVWASPRLEQSINQGQRRRAWAAALIGTVVLGTLLYALAFSAIYSRPHTRIEASRWIYNNLPAGSTLANEHWDDWLPVGGLDGKTSYGDTGIFKSVEMANYEPDTPAKLDRLIDNLIQADYIILSSNRLSDSIPRQPLRYPMTSRYYGLLFSGELGFEKTAEFNSYPTLFGIRLNDQLAEESFSVYDHPRVLIFGKTSSFNSQEVRQKLNSGIEWSAVLQLNPLQTTLAPTALSLTAGERSLYQRVAAWSSAYVNEQSWGSRLPVLAWVLVLEIIGLLALPLVLLAFPRLTDRGYIFSKAAGLLLVAWGAWLAASTRLAPFTRWQILAVILALAVLSGWISYRKSAELMAFLRAKWRLVLFQEALFWGLFALALFVRWSNPDLWHPFMGGEKPMDLAYLNAIVRTPYFPAYDPWFAGGYINYYYFGFVLVAVLVHLTGIVPHVAYNLAVPTFFAMLGMGAFTVAYNLAGGAGRIRGQEPRSRALIAGLCGVLFVAIIGNLGQLHLLYDGVRSISLIRVEGDPSTPTKIAQFFDGLVQWSRGSKIELKTEWWYWNATRIIKPVPGEAGPINEMPVFTFLFGDLHAHMMALPYTVMVLGLALNQLRGSGQSEENQAQRFWDRVSEAALPVGLLALGIGALWVMNTWDLPTYTAIAAAAVGWAEYARRSRLDLTWLWRTAGRMALVVAGGYLLFTPYHQAYAGSYLGFELWKGSQTTILAYLEIHGFFLFVIGSYLLTELLVGSRLGPLARSLRLVLLYWNRPRRLRDLFTRLGNQKPAYSLALKAGLGAAVLVLAVLIWNGLVGIILALLLLSLVLLLSSPAPRRQFLLSLTALGLALTVLVEFFVLKGDISRMNTVFKFYLQTWVMWALVAAAVLPQLAARPQYFGAWKTPKGWAILGALLAACLIYPLTAVPVRISDRFEGSQQRTLDGSAYMRSAVYNDQGENIALDWDRQAIEWLRENTSGIPVILEAQTPLYRWGSRVSIYTGLPTVIGWDWHQKQQRSILPGGLVERRIDDVRAIYMTNDSQQALALLERYGVSYIYAGPLERRYYGEEGFQKFDQMDGQLWNLVYQNEQVKIYRVR